MTKEEKAKAYDEALERARKSLRAAGDVGTDIVTFIFPDLRESDDERIRKALVWHLKAGENFVSNGVRKEECIAYLEKQKEQNPVEIHIDNPNVQKFDPDVKVTTSDSSADGKELFYVSNKSYKIGYRDGVASVKPAEWSEKHIANVFEKVGLAKIVREQGNDALTNAVQSAMIELSKTKPAEWSEEDKQILHSFEVICQRLIENPHGEKFEVERSYAKKMLSWLKSIKPQPKQEWNEDDEKIRKALIWHLKADVDFVSNGVTKTECLAYLDKQKAQKQEWSEEDKRILKGIVGLIDHDQHYGVGNKEMLDWLKSLRPSWKPSEEQMNVLLNTEGMVRTSGYPENAKVLASLYKQLKAIKED